MKNADKTEEHRIDELKELRRRIAELEALEAQRKRAEQQIRELSAGVGQSIDGIAIGDLQPQLTYVNDAFASMHGYSPQEMIGMKVENLHNEQQIDEYKRGMHQIKTQGSWRGQIDHIRRDGTPFPTYMSVTLLKDEKQRPTGILAVCRDITEHKQAAEALRQSEAQKKAILDASVDRIRLADRDLRIIWANQTALTSLNVAGEDLVGKHCYQAFHGRNTPCPECPSRNALKSGRIEHTILYRPKEQQVVKGQTYVDSYGVPIKDASGEIVALIQINRDITETKTLEEALKIKDSAIESSINAMALAELEGSLTYVNRSFLSLWGYDSNQEVIGRSAQEFWQVQEEALGVIEALRETGSWVGELTARRKDGSPFDAQLSANMVTDDAGEPLVMMGSFVDITERKRAEKALRRRERELELKTASLEEANAALKVLLKRREEDKRELEEKVLSNVKELIVPYVEKMKKSPMDARQMALLGIIESHLADIVAPFLHKLSSKYSNLTPKEIQVAALVKEGKTTKEIAGLLVSGTDAIEFHRKSLRRKLGLTNTKANLRSYLMSVP
jgi:PAS domain S-box-containing protein